jgi:glycosyltransferase involved in cell wall biosynthesis
MNTSVSVVIPCYNQSVFLADAISSVRAQNWRDLEIIVIDDGSTDGTAGKMKSLAGPDLHFIEQENAGPSVARNRGIAEASGEWIGFLDADDTWLPEKLRIQFEEILQNSNIGCCYSDNIRIYPDGEKGKAESPLPDGPLQGLVYGNLFPTSTILVRRDCFQVVGMFDPDLRMGEDWDMWLRLAAHFEFIRVPHPLATYRMPEVQSKYSSELLEYCTLRVLGRLFSSDKIKKDYPELLKKQRQVYSWHHSVLAKSHFKQGRFKYSLLQSIKAMQAHPYGSRYLIPGSLFR